MIVYRIKIKLLKFHKTVIFITHDLALAGGLCDDIMVMDSGKIVEREKAEKVLFTPEQEYTKRLLDAVLM